MNKKIGFDWYAVDTDRYQNIKIKRLKKAHGGQGVAVMDFLFCEIYRNKGYFLPWNAAQLFNVAEYFNLTEQAASEIVNTCITIEIFNREILEKWAILTGRAIQERALFWSEKARRTGFKIDKRFDLLTDSPQNVTDSPQNVTDSPQNVNSLPGREEKRREEKGRDNNQTATILKNDFLGFEKEKENQGLKMPYAGAEFAELVSALIQGPKFKARGGAALQSALNELKRFNKQFSLNLIRKCIAGGYAHLVYPDTGEKFKQYKEFKKAGAVAGKKAAINDSTQTHTKNQYNGFN